MIHRCCFGDRKLGLCDRHVNTRVCTYIQWQMQFKRLAAYQANIETESTIVNDGMFA